MAVPSSVCQPIVAACESEPVRVSVKRMFLAPVSPSTTGAASAIETAAVGVAAKVTVLSRLVEAALGFRRVERRTGAQAGDHGAGAAHAAHRDRVARAAALDAGHQRATGAAAQQDVLGRQAGDRLAEDNVVDERALVGGVGLAGALLAS